MVATLPKLLGCIVILTFAISFSLCGLIVKTFLATVGIDKLGEKLDEVDFIRKNQSSK